MSIKSAIKVYAARSLAIHNRVISTSAHRARAGRLTETGIRASDAWRRES